MWRDVVATLLLFAYYVVTLALVPGLLRMAGAPQELVRKLQHVCYSWSVFLLVKLFSAWYVALAASALLVVVAYPTLWRLERSPLYRRLLVDRRPQGGELRAQLLLVQVSFGLLITVFWGILGTNWRYLVPVAVMAWGYGDAAAALVGKAAKSRVILSRFIDGPKTYAGTGAMVVAAALAMFFTLWVYGGKSWPVSLLTAVVVAPACALVELFSRRGCDTLTVPFTAATLMLPLVRWLSLLGW